MNENKIYVPMTKEEYLEYIKEKEAKELNDENVVNYICEKYKLSLRQHYNYLGNYNINDIRVPIELKSGNMSIKISEINIKTNEW